MRWYYHHSRGIARQSLRGWECRNRESAEVPRTRILLWFIDDVECLSFFFRLLLSSAVITLCYVLMERLVERGFSISANLHILATPPERREALTIWQDEKRMAVERRKEVHVELIRWKHKKEKQSTSWIYIKMRYSQQEYPCICRLLMGNIQLLPALKEQTKRSCVCEK